MHHRFKLEVFRNGQWLEVKDGITATLASLGSALHALKAPGEPWRTVRDDGQVFYP